MNFNILIFGCGNIGSRHLQGLLKNKNVSNISIIEKNIASINVAKKRILNNIDKHKVLFYKNLNFKKKKFDLCIIATTSEKRLAYIKEIIKKKLIKNLIIEKVAFQNIKDLRQAEIILKGKNITTWVNCPRRSYKIYKYLKKKINSKNKILMRVRGNPWNMASNMIHFIDLFMFFSKKLNGKYAVTLYKDNKIVKSKRKQFIEIKGKIKITNLNGDILIFEDSEKIKKELIIEIENNKNFYKINESKLTFNMNEKNKQSEVKFTPPFQSYLSEFYIDRLIKYNDLELSKISESYYAHKILFNIVNAQLDKHYKKKIISCPIS